VIFTVAYANEAQLIMKQAKELRIDAKLYAGGAAGFAIPEFIKGAQDAAEYVVSATLWTPQLNYPGAKAFADKYKAKHGDYPSYHGASAYAALFVTADALNRAKDWTPTLSATPSRQRTSRPPTARQVRGQGRLPEPELP